jgi:heptosyltransferase III
MATLVYHSGALGDFITALPAIGVWRRIHPGEPAILLGRPGFAELALPAFERVIDAGSPACAPLFAQPYAGDAGLSRMLEGVSAALLFAAGSSALPQSLAALGVTEILRQDPFPPARVHIVDYHLSLFKESDLNAQDQYPRIALPGDSAAVFTRCAALHPGSGSARKNWPRDRFVALARRLMEQGLRVAWVSGPVEREEKAPPGAEAWVSLALPELARRFSQCVVFVGNDSGAAHLSAACGCPTVALFGVTDPAVWAPRGRNVKVVTSIGGGMNGIELSEVVRLSQSIVAM